MLDRYEFEYAVIRVVPRVEREEFINAGVILFCKRKNFLGVKWHLDEKLLIQLSPESDIEGIRENLCLFDKITKGGPDGGHIALLSTPERFRWLTATRSTVIQTSATHPGYTSDPQETLEQLYIDLVIR